MKYIILFLGLFNCYFTAMSQESKKVIITNSFDDLSVKLDEIKSKDEVIKLFILVEENIKNWRLTPVFNGKFDYDNQPHNYNNPIIELPKSIEQFANLEYLDVSDLGLSGLGTSIPKLNRLKTLNISFNEIRIEEEFDKLSALSNLDKIIAFGCDISSYAVMLFRDLSKPINLIYTNSSYVQNRELYFGWRKDYVKKSERHLIVRDLLISIHQYYPIGLPILKETFPGYQKLQEILEKEAYIKQNDFKNSKWYRFIQNLRQDHKWQIEEFSVNGLPSETLSIIFGGDRNYDDEFKMSTRIYLQKSLISHYYTIYFESKISFLKFREFKRPLHQTIIYGLENSSDQEKEIVKYLQLKFQLTYPDFEFIQHDLLMNTMVKGGVPLGEEIRYSHHEYSIFSFLFGQMLQSDVKIIK